ncbi:low affinity immunoglobulin epsilon Fc receptor [Kogia breviceps]|uniref:low affinity immunoglobulin epsilon Fc receptor n=1 Tax=Kogia breviceps TaxID=27615 RepID=UPI0027963618|nr:low affinity immunoglobulin epsilon Fc receptor [Kogia breviceps]
MGTVHGATKCYYFGEGTKEWIQAQHACSKLQGRLVSIHSQEERDFLTKHSIKRGSWIGLRDLDMEGEFIWMDNNPLDYSHWQPGEPNGAGQGENCVMTQGSGQCNHAFCGSHLNGRVCDRWPRAGRLPASSALDPLGSGPSQPPARPPAAPPCTPLPPRTRERPGPQQDPEDPQQMEVVRSALGPRRHPRGPVPCP